MERNGLAATPEQADRLHHFAHDLRNRLGGLQQVLRMIASSEPVKDSAELSEFAEQQYFKAMRLTEELLDDMVVVRGTQQLDTIPVVLGAAVRSAIEFMAHRFTRKGQTVEVEQSTELKVQADPKHLEELLTALLSNASKFSPKGGVVRVVIGHEGDMAFVDIADNGVGLEAKDLPLVFTRYAVLSSRSTGGEEQGRASLARAKQWAQAMGGDLGATSEGPGMGCTFRVTLRPA